MLLAESRFFRLRYFDTMHTYRPIKLDNIQASQNLYTAPLRLVRDEHAQWELQMV